MAMTEEGKKNMSKYIVPTSGDEPHDSTRSDGIVQCDFPHNVTPGKKTESQTYTGKYPKEPKRPHHDSDRNRRVVYEIHEK